MSARRITLGFWISRVFPLACLNVATLPLFNFVVSIVRLLYVSWISLSVIGNSDRCNNLIPVFIITWVVARLTFFLKPKHKIISAIGQVQFNWKELSPAQDIAVDINLLNRQYCRAHRVQFEASMRFNRGQKTSKTRYVFARRPANSPTGLADQEPRRTRARRGKRCSRWKAILS